MCAASSDSGRSSNSHSHYRDAEAAPAQPQSNANGPAPAVPGNPLLDSILNRGGEAGAQSSGDAATWDKLRDVARRHRGEALSQSPIVVELVAASLHPSFSTLAGPRAAEMTEQIAETLWNDPPSHERLTALWNSLHEAANG
jgi:hypothetical protein